MGVLLGGDVSADTFPDLLLKIGNFDILSKDGMIIQDYMVHISDYRL